MTDKPEDPKRPEPLDWLIEGDGRSTLSFRAIPPGSGIGGKPQLMISVSYERDTVYTTSYHSAGSIDLYGDDAIKFARDLFLSGQGEAVGTYWRLVCDNTQHYQFVLYNKGLRDTGRALRRFHVPMLSLIPTQASAMLKVLRWSPEPAPVPQQAKPTPQQPAGRVLREGNHEFRQTPDEVAREQRAPTPDPVPQQAAPVPPTSIDDGRRIRELENEVAELRRKLADAEKLAAFYRQYKPGA